MKLSAAEKESLRRRLAFIARQQLGKPYVFGAWTEEAPRHFDCSSFVQYCYMRIGIDLPRVSIKQARLGRRVPVKAGRLRAGDLIFVRGGSGHYDRRFPQGIGHVILVVGPDEVIHAKSRRVRGREAGRVISEPLAKILRRPDITVIKRII